MRELRRPRFSKSSLQICLNDGADEGKCACQRFESKGTIFDSRWYFEPMDSIKLCIACNDPGCQCRRRALEGVVLDCRRLAADRYETTVLFVEPDPIDGAGIEDFFHVPA